MKRTCIILLTFLMGLPSWAQLDSLQHLDEVVLSDVRLFRNSEAQQVSVLTDSVLGRNEEFLSSLLKFNSPIHFRENGNGMVSSASFRGTTASQTAVVWNGININSQFTGQTDFNALTTTAYDQVAVRHGGGSVLYGSGAVGGSVHLNNHFVFRRDFSSTLRLGYGSFNSFSGDLKARLSNQSTSAWVSISRSSSDNDFKYLGTDRHNENGDIQQEGAALGVAHLLGERHSLKVITDYSRGTRGFSGTLTAPSRSQHRDINSRNLLEWKARFERFTGTLRLAYLDETYRYYENRNSEDHSFGIAKTGIAKYDVQYDLSDNLSLTGVGEYRYTDGEGSDIGIANRDIGSLSVLMNHQLGKFFYELSLRGETSNRFSSPLLYSLGTGYQVSNFYGLRFNFSRNYRIPTFNDLFWRAGGNMELQPEESLQLDLGHQFQIGALSLNLSTYFINISNLLRWIPDSNGAWRPENTKDVQNYGLEAILGYEKTIGTHKIDLTGTYAYTQTEDQAKNKELIYVPKHKATAAVGYSVEDFSFFYQFLFTDKVFTSSDNNYSLDGYTVSNSGVYYTFGKQLQLRAGVEVRNLWNTYYESMPSRPMPGRSFHVSMAFKI